MQASKNNASKKDYWGQGGGFDDDFDNLDNLALSEHTESQHMQSARQMQQDAASDDESSFARDVQAQDELDFDDEPVIVSKKVAISTSQHDVRKGL